MCNIAIEPISEISTCRSLFLLDGLVTIVREHVREVYGLLALLQLYQVTNWVFLVAYIWWSRLIGQVGLTWLW